MSALGQSRHSDLGLVTSCPPLSTDIDATDPAGPFRARSGSCPLLRKPRFAEAFGEPFIVGQPSRIIRHRQLLFLKLADGSALGPAVREICLDGLACFGLLSA